MKTKNLKKEKRVRNHSKIRTKIMGSALRPRLAVFKSNKYIYAQLIDDDSKKTLASASSKDMKAKTLLLKSEEVGKIIAKEALAKNIKKVVFDRGGFIFTGRIRAVAEGARSGGLLF